MAMASTRIAIAMALCVGISHADPRIERIEIHGNARTRDKVIRRAFGIFEGWMLELGDLDRARRRVESLGYFVRVGLRLQPGSSAELVRIDIDVKERAGATKHAGFSSTDNFIAVCTMQQKAP